MHQPDQETQLLIKYITVVRSLYESESVSQKLVFISETEQQKQAFLETPIKNETDFDILISIALPPQTTPLIDFCVESLLALKTLQHKNAKQLKQVI